MNEAGRQAEHHSVMVGDHPEQMSGMRDPSATAGRAKSGVKTAAVVMTASRATRSLAAQTKALVRWEPGRAF